MFGEQVKFSIHLERALAEVADAIYHGKRRPDDVPPWLTEKTATISQDGGPDRPVEFWLARLVVFLMDLVKADDLGEDGQRILDIVASHEVEGEMVGGSEWLESLPEEDLRLVLAGYGEFEWRCYLNRMEQEGVRTMSKKHTLTLTIELSLPEEHGDLVIGEIPADELPVLFLQRKITVSLDDGPVREIGAQQAEWVLEMIDELSEGALTHNGQTALYIIAGPGALENL